MGNGAVKRDYTEYCDLGSVKAAIDTAVWREEFDSGPVPDEMTWSYDIGDGGWGNRELQTYTRDPANVRVENSHLVITALKHGGRITSGRIKTQDNFFFKYGTVEARVQFPVMGHGLWPAFWLLGNRFSNIGWPACGEIIMMEMGVGGAVEAGVVKRRIMSAAHWEHNHKHRTDGSTLDCSPNLDGLFHHYRMEWTPTSISTYIENRPIWSLDTSGMEQFHEPCFMLLNLAVGGEHTGVLDVEGVSARFPAEYRVDYIRVFDNGFTVLGDQEE